MMTSQLTTNFNSTAITSTLNIKDLQAQHANDTTLQFTS